MTSIPTPIKEYLERKNLRLTVDTRLERVEGDLGGEMVEVGREEEEEEVRSRLGLKNRPLIRSITVSHVHFRSSEKEPTSINPPTPQSTT